MRHRGNYGFERRRKESARRERQQAKRQRKADRVGEGATGPEMGESQPAGSSAGSWEWFSPSRNRVVISPAGARPDLAEPDDWVLLTEPSEQPGDTA
jgi:hypothetical protein